GGMGAGACRAGTGRVSPQDDGRPPTLRAAPMIQQALLGLAQLNDPRVRRIVWLSVAITVASLTVLVLLAWEALNWVTFFEDGTLEWLADLAAGLGATILVILL